MESNYVQNKPGVIGAEQVVRDALSDAGWSEDEVDTIMSHLHRRYRYTPLPKKISPNRSFTTNRKKVGPVIVEHITELWGNPVMSLTDIASALSLTVSTTRRLATDLNLPRRKSGPKVLRNE